MSELLTPPSTQLAQDTSVNPTCKAQPTCHPTHYIADIPDPIILQVCSNYARSVAGILTNLQWCRG